MKGVFLETHVSNASLSINPLLSLQDDGILIQKMKKRDFKAFQAAIGGKTRKDQNMKIFYRDLNRGFEPDGFCLRLWDMTMPDWIPENLRADMVDALRGFDEEMALEIADNLIDCWTGLGLHVTGIGHVDELLGRLYMRILSCAHRNGIKLEYDE